MKIKKLEKALKFVNKEIRSLELAPTINGCEMTDRVIIKKRGIDNGNF